MATAYNLVPDRFADGRHEALSAGLKTCGFEVRTAYGGARIHPETDCLVTWNLHHGAARQAAAAFEKAGAPVIVCEEAYTRRLWCAPHFAMALGEHNGAGRWCPGGPERWARLGIALAPWRRDGEHVLVCAARGMGSAEMREPRGWADDVCRRLGAITRRPVRLRRHPGKAYRARPLEEDLAEAWAVVVWASNCATHALVAGVPVFYEALHIVTAGAAQRDIGRIDDPAYPDRLPVFQRLAWAQWHIDEIAKGAPFRHLLHATHQTAGAAAL